MNIIIPMAGRGTRMRPHTLTVPKPLTKIAGKPIVHRLLEDIGKVCTAKIDEIAFIIGDFGKDVEDELLKIAKSLGAVGKIYYQNQALGTAHAVWCARESLEGNVIVAFADTLFDADFELDTHQDGIIWVKQVDNPSSFGVVKLDGGYITDFIEKPKNFVSDLAIIGIYYMKQGEILRQELDYLIDNKIMHNHEFQLTDALENMKAKGFKFIPERIKEWLDCGNKEVTVHTHQRYLEYIKNTELVAQSAKIENTVIISPVYIGEHAELSHCVVGPHVSIGDHTKIKNSIIRNSIIQNETCITNANIENSMIGNHVKYTGKSADLSIGDYTMVK